MKDIKAKIIGGQIPRGKVKVSGAKNAATRLLAASLICDDKVTLTNFPGELIDVKHKVQFILNSDGEVKTNDDETIEINSLHLRDKELAHYDYPIRTTYLLVPGLIKRSGTAKIPYPGGCKIGNRGYDLHIMVWEKMGAVVIERGDYIEVNAPKGFNGANIEFPISTIGGTESALICAAIANGVSTISNAYISPEVACLISFLKDIGVEIEVVGNSLIRVVGTSSLKGSTFAVMPDRIEALTWMVYAALSGGDILIEDVPFDSMEIPLLHLKDIGIDFFRNTTSIRISRDCLKGDILHPFELATGTHPGVISDMQPFYVLLGLHAKGVSRVYDYRYPERLKYCNELKKFYPNMITFESGKITTKGQPNYLPKATSADSTDLRGSMAILMAALISDGESQINNVEMALRGYNRLAFKLSNLGIRVHLS